MRRRIYIRSHWEREPYHEIVDSLVAGDVVVWKRRGNLRVIRALKHVPFTDHVQWAEFVKVKRSGYLHPLTSYPRSELKRSILAVHRDHDPYGNPLEARLQKCTDRYFGVLYDDDRDNRKVGHLQNCVTENEVVGIIR